MHDLNSKAKQMTGKIHFKPGKVPDVHVKVPDTLQVRCFGCKYASKPCSLVSAEIGTRLEAHQGTQDRSVVWNYLVI